MNIIKCSSCGEYIHIGNLTGKICIFCGAHNEEKSNEANPESHVFQLGDQGEALLGSKMYSKALKHYDDAIELYPDVAEFYWCRLLAKHGCSDDFSLIKKGANLENEPDFSVAYHFGNDYQKGCYAKLNLVNKKLTQDIIYSLGRAEIDEKYGTGIEAKKQKAEKDIFDLEKKLSEQLLRLDSYERNLRDLSIDANAILETEKSRINGFVSKIEKVKLEVQSKSEVTYDNYNAYLNAIKKYQGLCESEMQVVQNRTNIITFEEIKRERSSQNSVEQEINRTIDNINLVCSSMKQLSITISQITKKYNNAISCIENGDYSQAVSLIGENLFTGMLQKYLKTAR